MENNREALAAGDKEIKAEVSRSLASSPSLRNREDLIMGFVDKVSLSRDSTVNVWQNHMAEEQAKELAGFIAEENLRPDATTEFMENAFRDGQLQTGGTAITKILPKASRFAPDGGHGQGKKRVIRKLGAFFERFFGLGADGGSAEI